MIKLPDNSQSEYQSPGYGTAAQPGPIFPRRVNQPEKTRAGKSRAKRLLKRILFLVVGTLLLVGGWIGYQFVRNTLKATNGNILGFLPVNQLNGESSGRVNILLAGNSSDDPNHGGAQLTDSLMIVSLNTKDNSAYIISIPRDTWVNTPGYGHQKINAVYPEGGMKLLEKVVSADFGVDVNYYTLVNYSAFKQAVDAVGGITINLQSSDPRGIYDPNIGVDNGTAALRLKNGTQTLDGQTALNLARARNDPTPRGTTGYGLPNGDFDRAANQRLMLSALKDKATSLTTLANPVKISELLDAIGSNVHTDFSAGDLKRLYDLGKLIPSNKIRSLSFQDSAHNINLLSNYTSSDGESALIPTAGLDDFNQIKHYIATLNSNDPVVKENAQIVVLNGSNVTGLAKTEAALLKGKNLNVISYATGPATVGPNQIIVGKSAKPATLSELKTLLRIDATTLNPSLLSQYPSADLIVILGTAQTGSPPTP
jgi:LCP family protein required for cell wall assembly